MLPYTTKYYRCSKNRIFETVQRVVSQAIVGGSLNVALVIDAGEARIETTVVRLRARILSIGLFATLCERVAPFGLAVL